MNTLKTEERNENASVRREKLLEILKKILIAVFLAAAALIALVVIYQVLEVLFVLAVLVIGHIRPKRW